MPIPKGKNNLSAQELFQERGVYDKEYPVTDHLNINPIDLWSDHKLLYGRVDLCGNPIYVQSNSLVQLPNGPEVLVVIDIVEEAFQDIQNSINKAVFLNRLDIANSTIFPLKPVKAWRNALTDYHSYLESMFQVFSSNFVNTAIDRKIVDYNSFEREFINFYKSIQNKFVFSFAGFITSSYASPLISGLMIEFSNDDHGDDTTKYQKYLQDPEFNFYKDIIKRHGFVLDKHAPWRIIADLESPPIKDRIANQLGNINEFFKNRFLSANYLAIENMSAYMHKMWDTFAAIYPVVTKPPSHHCPIVNKTRRQRLTLEEFRVRYGRKHWLKFYIKIRNMETRKNLSNQQLKLITKNAFDIFKYKRNGFPLTEKEGDRPALDYVQQVFGGFSDQIRETKPLTE